MKITAQITIVIDNCPIHREKSLSKPTTFFTVNSEAIYDMSFMKILYKQICKTGSKILITNITHNALPHTLLMPYTDPIKAPRLSDTYPPTAGMLFASVYFIPLYMILSEEKIIKSKIFKADKKTVVKIPFIQFADVNMFDLIFEKSNPSFNDPIIEKNTDKETAGSIMLWHILKNIYCPVRKNVFIYGIFPVITVFSPR